MSEDEVFSAGGITNEGLDIIDADIKAGKYTPEVALDLGLLVEEVRNYRSAFSGFRCCRCETIFVSLKGPEPLCPACIVVIESKAGPPNSVAPGDAPKEGT